MTADEDQAGALVERAYNLKTAKESKALYRDWADTYEETMVDGLGYLTPANTADLLNQHLGAKDALVLDVGCGTGLAGKELAKLGFKNLHALDFSADMLEVAKKSGVYSETFQIDLTREIELGSETYDAMICTGTFTHAHVGAGCLDELFRILKPGGLFACTVHKDIWSAEGFEAKVAQLEAKGILAIRHHEMGIYFANSSEPEGWYIVWQRC